MDGVVVDSMGMWRNLLPSLKEELGLDLDEEMARDLQAQSIDLSCQFLVDHFDLDMTAKELNDRIERKVANFYMMQAKLKEGVYDLMPLLRYARMKVCLATATPKKLARMALNKNDVAEHFPRIFSVPEIGKGKSSPDIFEAALEYLGTAPEETLVVEDSDIAIRTAHEMGMKTCAVYDGVNDAILDTVADITDMKITSLKELEVLVEG